MKNVSTNRESVSLKRVWSYFAFFPSWAIFRGNREIFCRKQQNSETGKRKEKCGLWSVDLETFYHSVETFFMKKCVYAFRKKVKPDPHYSCFAQEIFFVSPENRVKEKRNRKKQVLWKLYCFMEIFSKKNVSTLHTFHDGVSPYSLIPPNVHIRIRNDSYVILEPVTFQNQKNYNFWRGEIRISNRKKIRCRIVP